MNIASLPLMERTGWWFKKFLWNHHPVCAALVASRRFLDRAATPPGQEGQCSLVQFYNLHHTVVGPGPAATEVEFLFTAGRGVRIVKACRCEDHAQFAKQFFENSVAVGQTREFNPVSVHVQYGGLFAG